ncbi:hypothetical protein Btru_003276 [Bulinus truncatus]|nr:hypothetical protein Btru_003276 [Bulinus truncatus]
MGIVEAILLISGTIGVFVSGIMIDNQELIITGVARSKWLVFFAVVIGMFKAIPAAGLRATISSLVTAQEQGRLFGIISATESMTALLSSLMFNELYPATYNWYPGFCYMLAAGILVATFLIVLFLPLFLLNGTPSR